MSKSPTVNFHPFSDDLWDYLEDMVYMPCRADRDALVAAGKEERVRIWDYFFRIRPSDIGQPQRTEMQVIRAELENEFKAHQEIAEALDFELRTLERRLQADLKRSLVIGIPLLLIGLIFTASLGFLDRSIREILLCGGIFGFPGIFFLVRAGLHKLNLMRARVARDSEVENLKAIQERQVRAARMRMNTLEQQIEYLKMQIPTPPPDSLVREWLNTDLAALHRRSVEQTGLESRLVPVEEINQIGDLMLYYNPIPVMGPGELQEQLRIPRTFAKEINPDLNKHLSARRAYTLADELSVDVLYGVYYIKYIAVTNDMLATYSLFYDLINGKTSGESITEQYYRDVVAITTTRETRHIMLGVDSEEYILVEEAPTLAIYLAGSEVRTVTFVNENYFHEIHNKLGLTADQVSQIYWVRNSDQIARDTVQLLRYYLREHKGDDYPSAINTNNI